MARQVPRDAPLSFYIAHVTVRDDSPVRRMAEPDEIFRTQVRQQSVLAVSIVAVVIGALLERLERNKGLDARGLASYLARWPLMEPRHVPLLERGLERYYSGDHISALHILIPQVEGVLRSISALQRGNAGVVARRRAVPEADVVVTVVSYQEQIRGRLEMINRHAGGPRLVQAFANLQATATFYDAFTVLPYDAAADAMGETLRTQLRRMGANDRRIDAIALAWGATLVTRNLQHFQDVPRLALEDWVGSDR